MFTKLKRKSKSQSWLRGLIFGRRIAFTAPIGLEECAARLEQRSQPYRLFSWSGSVKVTIDRGEADHYDFRLHKDAGKNLNVWVVGDLDRIDEHATRVTGRGLISRLTYFIIVASIAFEFYIARDNSWVRDNLIFAFLITSAYWIVSAVARNYLIRVVFGALGNDVL